MRENVPGTAVPEIGKVEQYITNIDRNGYFEVTNLSEDDIKRNEMYKANVERAKLESTFTNYTDYLLSLNMTAVIRDFDDVYIQRIAQLTNKSNQFNLTTKRFTQAEMEAIMADDRYVRLYGKLEDKYGDNGVIDLEILDILAHSVSESLAYKSVRCAVEAVLSYVQLLVALVGKTVHERLLRHGGMERGIEYDYLRSRSRNYLLACSQGERVGVVMYRCELCEVVYLLDNFVCNEGGLAEDLSALYYSVAYGGDLTHAVDDLALAGGIRRMNRAVKLLHHAVAVRKAEIRKAGIPACRIRRRVKRSVGRGIEIIVDVQPVNVVIRDYFGGSCRDKLRYLVVCRVQVVGIVDVHCVLPRHSIALCKGVDRKASVAGNIRAAARTQRIYPGVERYPALVSLGDRSFSALTGLLRFPLRISPSE